jgi:hypothetical protein
MRGVGVDWPRMAFSASICGLPVIHIRSAAQAGLDLETPSVGAMTGGEVGWLVRIARRLTALTR